MTKTPAFGQGSTCLYGIGQWSFRKAKSQIAGVQLDGQQFRGGGGFAVANILQCVASPFLLSGVGRDLGNDGVANLRFAIGTRHIFFDASDAIFHEELPPDADGSPRLTQVHA